MEKGRLLQCNKVTGSVEKKVLLRILAISGCLGLENFDFSTDFGYQGGVLGWKILTLVSILVNKGCLG